MARKLRYYIFLSCITASLAKDPEPDLPPCPTNFQFLPQNLPMHCKMPNAPSPGFPMPPFPPPFPAVPDPGKSPVPVLPPSPAGMPMPMGMGPPMPMGMPGMPVMPGMPGMPGLPGMPMGMPMLGGPPQSKLPVIVMPFYSPDPSFKNPKGGPNRRPKPYKRKIKVVKHNRHRYSDDDSSTDTDSSDTGTDTSDSADSDRGRWNWKNRRSMRRRKKIKHEKKDEDYLTPILQYVSKDGYVIFEKEISKGEAKNWLGDSKDGGQGNKESLPNKNTSNPEEEDEHRRMKNKPVPNDPEHKVVVKFKKQKNHRLKANQLPQPGPRKGTDH